MKLRSTCPSLILTTLAAVLTAAAQPQKTETNAGAKLPAAREVIDRFVEKMGGEEAIRKHTSTVSKGTFEMPAMGITGSLEARQAAPNKMSIRIDLPGVGVIRSGYDGKVGWEINPLTGPRIIKGTELEQLKADYDFYGPLHEAENFKSMETVELIEFEGRPAYKLKLERRSGHVDYEFFDKETSLQIGSVLTREQPTGRLEVTNVIGDYKKFNGLLMPTKVTQKVLGMQQVMTLTDVEFDNVKPETFELPPEIKTLTGQ